MKLQPPSVRDDADTAARPPLLSVTLLSAIALAYEVLLMRLLSIVQWHHFAYMIISLALLGYGVSGSFLTIAQHRLLQRYALSFIVNAALFAVSLVICFHAAQRIDFNAEEVLWDPGQLLRLAAIYLLLAVPFFFIANAVALSLMRFRDRVQRIYAFDLVGAGMGSVSIVSLLFVAFPAPALMLLGALAFACVGIAAWELSLQTRGRVAAAAAVAAVVLILGMDELELAISPYKGLPQTLRVAGAEVVSEHSSPLGYLSVVESARVPLRHAPGLSLRATDEPPRQVAVFTDADNMTVITKDSGDPAAFRYLDSVTSALPYHLLSSARVLILGAGGGEDVQQALHHGASHVTAVEVNPQIVDIVRDRYGDFSRHLLDRTGVTVHVSEARGFVSRDQHSYDLIQLALLDSFAASSAGLYALNETYLYTVEALRTYYKRLRPGGYLAITRWIKLPPRDTLKLFATAVEALRRENADDPGLQLALIRSWQTSTLLMKNGVLNNADKSALKRFAADRAFDLAWYPSINESEANRFNLLRQPYFYQAATSLLGPRSHEFLDQYKYNVRPATDDRPYFSHFFKWRVFPEIVALRGRGGMPLLELGYLILVATLLKALIASLVLILLPLFSLKGPPPGAMVQRRYGRTRVLWYFFAIGIAFLFVEIGFIQKFLLFLHHPVYAIAVTLSAFLVFAGLGSAATERAIESGRHRRTAAFAVSGIVVFATLYTWILDPLFAKLVAQPTLSKAVVSVALIAPLAYCMGMPFPLALARLGATAQHLVPWAWGINGCSSVISAVLATLCAIHFGFVVVVLLAVVLYISAALTFPRASAMGQGL